MNTCGTSPRPCLALLVLALGAGSAAARADGPEKTDRPAEKTLAFTFVNKPWTEVIEWFADNTGLGFVGNFKPAGTLTFIPPKVNGRVREYTLAETVDVLNEALQVNSATRRYVLIRRSQTFTLVPADDKIPKDMIPTVDVADLPRRGRTEVVRLNVTLDGADAEETAPKLKLMMTQFGDAVAVGPGHHLVLVDTVGSLTEVMKTLRAVGEGSKDAAQRYVHQCRFIKAREGERVLRELFGLPPVLPAEMQMWMRVALLQQQMQQQQQQQQQQQHAGGTPRPPAPKVRPVAVAAAEETNTVIVTGPADKVAEAKQTLTELEEKARAAGAKEQPAGPAMVKCYKVPDGDAEALSRMLQEKYRSAPSVRVVNLGPSEVMVWAPAADHFDIADLISGGLAREKVKLIALGGIDAYGLEYTLKGMFGDRSKTPKAPYVEAQSSSTLSVRGTEDQIREIEAVVKALDVGPGPTGPVREFTLERGSAEAVAEELQRLLEGLGHEVRILKPGDGNDPKKSPKSARSR
jgi:hypothetical protein